LFALGTPDSRIRLNGAATQLYADAAQAVLWATIDADEALQSVDVASGGVGPRYEVPSSWKVRHIDPAAGLAFATSPLRGIEPATSLLAAFRLP
jgi:hypothetical protein